MPEKTFISRGGAWVVGQSFLLGMAAFVSVYFREQFAPFPLQMGVALGIFSLSAAIGVSGVLALGKQRTPFPSPLPQSQLVSVGIYGFVRHPLYLSMILWAVSWPLFWCSAAGLVFAAVIAVFFDLKARHEERLLLEAHAHYEEYARRVRRFIPRLY